MIQSLSEFKSFNEMNFTFSIADLQSIISSVKADLTQSFHVEPISNHFCVLLKVEYRFLLLHGLTLCINIIRQDPLNILFGNFLRLKQAPSGILSMNTNNRSRFEVGTAML